jgi:iron complex outermembrane receptor protein
MGDQDLKSEFSWQFDVGADYSSAIISAQAALFLNRIDNYIFIKRLAGVETEGYQTYQYTSGDARLWGAELSVDIHPVEPLHFENSIGFVDARLLNQPLERRYLPCTPPLHWKSELRYDLIRDGQTLTNTFVALNVNCYAKQSHYLMEDDSETATPAYCLLGASIGTQVKHKGKVIANVSIIGDNLLDKAYQSHLSRLKYADVNAVTGRMGVFNMGRNVTFKLDIPLTF